MKMVSRKKSLAGVLCCVTMLLSVPCMAGWIYVGKDIASGPPSDYQYTPANGLYWGTEKEEYYNISNCYTDAGPWYARADADCSAGVSAHSGSWGASAGVSAYAWASSWSESSYKNDPYAPNDALNIDYYINISGTVFANGDSGNYSPTGSGGAWSSGTAQMDASEDTADAWAAGQVSGGGTGSIDYDSNNGTHSVQSSSIVARYYEIEIDFSLSVDDDYDFYGRSYDAFTEIFVDAQGSAYSSGSPGSGGCIAVAGCGGLVDIIVTP